MPLDDLAEEEIGRESSDAFEISTSGDSVTGAHLFADGGDGLEKEVVILDPAAGASSSAPASSGIPSAMRQQAIHDGLPAASSERNDQTTMADRTIPMREDTKP